MVLWLMTSLVAVAGPRKKNRSEPPPPAIEAPAPAQMTNDRLNAFLVGVLGAETAEGIRIAPNQWSFELLEQPVTVLTDENADRMRIMIPIGPAAGLPPGFAERMLQANFDSALDARYAIARGMVWSTFIHPLSPLDDEQLASG
ncbi:MAG: type III secretion system chaperone, partial [Myxococcota bacterium]